MPLKLHTGNQATVVANAISVGRIATQIELEDYNQIVQNLTTIADIQQFIHQTQGWTPKAGWLVYCAELLALPNNALGSQLGAITTEKCPKDKQPVILALLERCCKA